MYFHLGWQCPTCSNAYATYAANPAFAGILTAILVMFLSGFSLLRLAPRFRWTHFPWPQFQVGFGRYDLGILFLWLYDTFPFGLLVFVRGHSHYLKYLSRSFTYTWTFIILTLFMTVQDIVLQSHYMSPHFGTVYVCIRTLIELCPSTWLP